MTESVFDTQAGRYDAWFDRHPWIYYSELNALRQALPDQGLRLEVGVGSGRFAGPLKIQVGVDVSLSMLVRARERGVRVGLGRAERLPLRGASFDAVLMVTTICFLDDVPAALAEVRRVLRPGGTLVIGFVDKKSFLGRQYQAKQPSHAFYQNATFYSVRQVLDFLNQSGFGSCYVRQTVFERNAPREAADPVRPGYGQGAFVVIQTQKEEKKDECGCDRGIG